MLKSAAGPVGTFCLFAALTDQLMRCLHRRSERKRQARLTRVLAKEIRDPVDPRLMWSATRLGAAIQAGELTSVELTLLCMAQLERTNLYTNAIVATRFDLALQEARLTDEEGSSASSPFWGVPIISKEVFELPGMPYTAGVVALRERYGQNTCPVLERVQLAGMIILGTGNVSEQCMWMESSNRVHGTSNNAYDCARTPGGSSGGTACAVSALCAPLGITSDVGGSTRIPSLFNGVFGLKPTGGTVSNAGTTPGAKGRVNWFCQLGPCARHAEDLFPLLQILASVPVTSPPQQAFPTKSPQQAKAKWVSDRVPLRQLRVLSCAWQFDTHGPLRPFRHARLPSMIAAQQRVVSALTTGAGQVEQVDFADFDRAFDIWSAYLGKETASFPFRMILAEGKSSSSFAGSLPWAVWELGKYAVSGGRWTDHTLPALALAVVEAFESLFPGKCAQLIAAGEQLKHDISKALGENGVLIVPSLPTTAPLHGPFSFLLRASESGAAGLFNVLEFPSVAVPLGLDEDTGLPVGVQVVANHGRDDLCLAVARALQQDLHVAGWVPPRE